MANISDDRPAARKKAVCPICQGAGFLLLDVPPDHPDFNKLVPCRCKAQELEQRRQDRLQAMSNLGGLARMTFEAFLPEGVGQPEDVRRNLRLAFEAARRFAERPEGWLVVTGGYGCGKTHLAAAIANAVIARGEPALFVVVPDLLDHLRATYAPTSDVRFDERFEEVRTSPLLILDDFGTQASTPWAQEKLYQIINYRYNARLPTVVTTNCPLEDLDPRVRSRLSDLELAQIVGIRAPDYRQSGGPASESAQNGLNSLAQVSDMSFETFSLRMHDLNQVELDNLQNALALAHSFAERPDGWLVFTGPHGTGKTHLAAAIANYQHSQGKPALFVMVPDLLDYLRAAFSPSSQMTFDKRLEEVRRAPLLILDDLGTENATPWAREKLFQIVNYRFNLRLPTVFTTVDPVEEQEPRFRARMLVHGRCAVFGLVVSGYTGLDGGAPPVEPPARRRQSRPRQAHG